jgi:hypothetical protein
MELEARLAKYENAHTPQSLRRGHNRKKDQKEGVNGTPGQTSSVKQEEPHFSVCMHKKDKNSDEKTSLNTWYGFNPRRYNVSYHPLHYDACEIILRCWPEDSALDSSLFIRSLNTSRISALFPSHREPILPFHPDPSTCFLLLSHNILA